MKDCEYCGRPSDGKGYHTCYIVSRESIKLAPPEVPTMVEQVCRELGVRYYKDERPSDENTLEGPTRLNRKALRDELVDKPQERPSETPEQAREKFVEEAKANARERYNFGYDEETNAVNLAAQAAREVSEMDAKTEREDYLDKGPMPSYSDPNKPVCLRCESDVWVVAVGRDHKWKWNCTNCTRDL